MEMVILMRVMMMAMMVVAVMVIMLIDDIMVKMIRCHPHGKSPFSAHLIKIHLNVLC